MEDVVDEPTLNVRVEKKTYKVGESVEFKFSGNPDNIIFFSGEQKKMYQYRNRIEAEGKPVLSFVTTAANGTQVNSLAIMVSEDFTGTYTPEGLQSATWKDITSSALLSQGTANVKSGDIDLSEFANADKAYIAFKFTGQLSELSTQRKWTITSFLLNNVTTEGTVYPLFANVAAAVWKSVDIKNPDRVWSATNTQLVIDGGPKNTPDNEDWMITSAVKLNAVVPDLGLPVKNMSTRSESYTYTYNTPGTYLATFLSSNVRAYGSKETETQVELTIEP